MDFSRITSSRSSAPVTLRKEIGGMCEFTKWLLVAIGVGVAAALGARANNGKAQECEDQKNDMCLATLMAKLRNELHLLEMAILGPEPDFQVRGPGGKLVDGPADYCRIQKLASDMVKNEHDRNPIWNAFQSAYFQLFWTFVFIAKKGFALRVIGSKDQQVPMESPRLCLPVMAYSGLQQYFLALVYDKKGARAKWATSLKPTTDELAQGRKLTREVELLSQALFSEAAGFKTAKEVIAASGQTEFQLSLLTAISTNCEDRVLIGNGACGSYRAHGEVQAALFAAWTALRALVVKNYKDAGNDPIPVLATLGGMEAGVVAELNAANPNAGEAAKILTACASFAAGDRGEAIAEVLKKASTDQPAVMAVAERVFNAAGVPLS